MDAPPRTPSSNIPSGPPVISRTASFSNRLPLLTEAEGEIFKLKSNTYYPVSQGVDLLFLPLLLFERSSLVK
jgi:hypothetical protein